MQTLRITKKSGFTLIETLVALSIFTVSILGMIVILADGTSNVSYAKSKTISTYLSQEGVELVRNLRDEYTLNGQGWARFKQKVTTPLLEDCVGAGCIAYIDPATYATVIQECPPSSGSIQGACPPLTRDISPASSGFYNYSNPSKPTAFQRVIRVMPMGVLGDELKVSSTVFWSYKGKNYTTVSSESLFNWQ